MPRGPKGEKRPADVIGNAVHVMRIATGEVEEDAPKAVSVKQTRGGHARASALSPEERSRIAKDAAAARWMKNNGRA